MLSQLFKLRQAKCRIPCPNPGCEEHFDTLKIVRILKGDQKRRLACIMRDLLLKDPRGNSTHLAKKMVELQEAMTLKCPSCQATVDPSPDGCSAVMCLNCGGHYCNVCFACFATGKNDDDRAAAHAHAATHATDVALDRRSAFLSNETVEKGQRDTQKRILIDYFHEILTRTADETKAELRHEAAVLLVLLESDLSDIGLTVTDFLSLLEAKLQNATTGKSLEKDPSSASKRKRGGNMKEKDLIAEKTSVSAVRQTRRARAAIGSSDTSVSGSGSEKELDVSGGKLVKRAQVDSALKKEEKMDVEMGDSSGMPTEKATAHLKKGGAAMANAILSDNQMAIKQLSSIPDEEFDFDYLDNRHGHPLASLAILTGKYDLALNLLTRGADPLKHNTSGRTVLYIAVEAGVAELVVVMLDMLKEKGVDAANIVSTTEVQAYRPLHIAARYNHGRVCELLVARGADLNVKEGEHGYTALTLALVLGHEWSSLILVRAGAQVTVKVKSNNGRSPMFVAAEKGMVEVIKLVLDERDDFNVNDPVVVPSGLRLLHVAAFHKRANVVKVLLDCGADKDMTDEESKSPPLIMSLIGKCTTCASILLLAGANAKRSNKIGRFPMDFALEHGLSEVVRLMISECGVDVNAPTNTNDKAKLPLNVAIIRGHRHLVPLLVSLGASINGSRRSTPPLLTAVSCEDEWAFQYLIDQGASIDTKSVDGYSLMYLAIEKSNSSMVSTLVSQGVEINEMCHNNRLNMHMPYLHVACLKDTPSMCCKLIALGADVDATDSTGETALDVAINRENKNVIDLLTRAADGTLSLGCKSHKDE